MNNTKYFILILFFCLSINNHISSWSFLGINFGGDEKTKEEKSIIKPIIIMVDPSWDVKFQSRKIGDTTEFELSYKLCQELKREIENELIQVIITKTAENMRNNLSNANWANKIKADLYLNIQVCNSKDRIKRLNIYNTIYNNSTDFWDLKQDKITFLPYDAAYKINLNKTKKFANMFYGTAKENKSKISIYEPIGFPCKPIMGVISPALMLEISIIKELDWQLFIEPIKNSILSIVSDIKNEKNHDSNVSKQEINILPVANN